ncbi:MAG: hypothetical protein NW241_03930 [Bacteroidia bacterium]|nr:hypothetical protein [Bacteroidia bacterium]
MIHSIRLGGLLRPVQRLMPALQVLLTAAALAYIWLALRQYGPQVQALAAAMAGRQWLLLAAAAGLMPLNLSLEAWKLRVLGSAATLREGWRAVLAGMSLGIFTPNRAGEYAGRLMSAAPGRRAAMLAHTWIGRMAQMLPTLAAGGLAGLLLAPDWPFPLPAAVPGLAIGLAAAGALLLVFGWKYAARWRPLRGSLDGVSGFSVRMVLIFSALRYAVFSIQYLLILYALGAGGGAAFLLSLTALLFWVKSLIPFMSVAELGIRESVALWLLPQFGIGPAAALGSAFLLYLINLVIPALMGLPELLRRRAC